MAKFIIHAGDFVPGDGLARFVPKPIFFKSKPHGWEIILPKGNGKGSLGFGERLSISDFASVEIANEESVKRMSGTIGWGLAGATVFGPVGLLVGLLSGGKKTEVTFFGTLQNGKKMLSTTDLKIFTLMQAAVMDNKQNT